MPRCPEGCSPSPNPRKAGRCVRCSRLPALPLRLFPDPSVEDAIVVRASYGYGSPDALNALANERALAGEVRVHGRDLIQEVREELADARNYLVWEIRRALLEGRSDHVPALVAALAGVVQAWCALEGL